jgi:hypothetical protein
MYNRSLTGVLLPIEVTGNASSEQQMAADP